MIWTESDLWKVFEQLKNNIPLYLINESFLKDQKKINFTENLSTSHGMLHKIYTVSKDQEAYTELGINSAEYMGNIKFLQES